MAIDAEGGAAIDAVATAFAYAYLQPDGPPSKAFIDAIPLAVSSYGCTDVTTIVKRKHLTSNAKSLQD